MDLQEILIRIATALGISIVLTSLARRLAIRWSFVDDPAACTSHRHKLHREPMPLLGGVAIYGAIFATMLIFPVAGSALRLWGLLGAATLVVATGLWDDHRGLPVIAKLLSQLVAAAILVSIGVFVDLALPVWIDGVLTILWIVGIINAFNLLDNMDGLAASAAAAAAMGFLVLTAVQQGVATPLAASLLGASLGFLIYNFHPAKIFMGDAGSLLLGLLLAVLGLELQTGRGQSEPWVAALVPLLVLAIPIFDTTLVTVSRWRRGHNPLTTPGNDHLSHRLERLGLSMRGTMLLVSLAGVACSGLAVIVTRGGERAALAATLVVFLIGLWAIFQLDGRVGSPNDDVGS